MSIRSILAGSIWFIKHGIIKLLSKMGPEVLPNNELTREEAFLAEFQRWIVSNYPEDNPHRKIEIEYFRRAEFFAQRLNFKSAPAIGIAIFSRAVERVFPSKSES